MGASQKLARKARNHESYRAFRRNDARSDYRAAKREPGRTVGSLMLRIGAKVIVRPYRGSVELNRSQNWSRCKTYSYAREISPSAEMLR